MKKLIIDAFYFIVGWWPFTVPAIILAFAGEWLRCLMVIGCMVFLMLTFELFMFALEGAKRHQGESWISFQRRMMRETDSLEQCTGAGRNYAYIRMDCGHLLMVHHDPSTYLAVGDEYWCFGHGRLHGAQLQRIVDPDARQDMTPEDYANVVI